jgi:hypothetical protein
LVEAVCRQSHGLGDSIECRCSSDLCNGNDDEMTTDEYVASFGQRQKETERKGSALSYKASWLNGARRRRPRVGGWRERGDGLRRRGVYGRRRATLANVTAAALSSSAVAVSGRKLIDETNGGPPVAPTIAFGGLPHTTRQWVELTWRASMIAGAVTWSRVDIVVRKHRLGP